MRLFKRMKAAGIRRNEWTYSSLINACAKGKQLALALELHRAMLTEGIPSNTVTFNTLIGACEKCSEWRLALQVPSGAAWAGETRARRE
eukprot:6169254-Pyramimonas_sp.AAC.1